MMRRILCLLLAVLVLATLVACKSDPAPSQPSDSPTNDTSRPSDNTSQEAQDGGADGQTPETPELPRDTPSTLTSHTFAQGSVTLGYLLYTPQNATDGMPMIVYLHGGSGKGSDTALLTANEGFPKYLADGRLGVVGLTC